MNDMEWSGIGDPEGPVTADAHVTDRAADQAEEDRRTADLEDLLAEAQGQLASCIRDLRRHTDALEERERGAVDLGELKTAIQSARAVRDAVNHMLSERSRVDKLRKDIAGGVGGGCLDLDAARTEIGRRLACLRRAGGG